MICALAPPPFVVLIFDKSEKKMLRARVVRSEVPRQRARDACSLTHAHATISHPLWCNVVCVCVCARGLNKQGASQKVSRGWCDGNVPNEYKCLHECDIHVTSIDTWCVSISIVSIVDLIACDT